MRRRFTLAGALLAALLAMFALAAPSSTAAQSSTVAPSSTNAGADALAAPSSTNAGASSAAQSSTAAPSSTNAGAYDICNLDTTYQVGVIHAPDGAYALGNYDAKLGTNGACTHFDLGWPHAGGAYSAAGYCIFWYTSGGLVATTGSPSVGVWKFPDNASQRYNVFVGRWQSPTVCY